MLRTERLPSRHRVVYSTLPHQCADASNTPFREPAEPRVLSDPGENVALSATGVRKICVVWGGCLAQSGEHRTPDVGVVSVSPRVSVDPP